MVLHRPSRASHSRGGDGGERGGREGRSHRRRCSTRDRDRRDVKRADGRGVRRVKDREHAVSTATAAAAKPNANETRPAATLVVPIPSPRTVPGSVLHVLHADRHARERRRIVRIDEFREACVFAVKVASSKRRCCGSTSRASPRRVANASTSNVSGSPGRNAPNLGGFGFEFGGAGSPPRASTSHSARSARPWRRDRTRDARRGSTRRPPRRARRTPPRRCIRVETKANAPRPENTETAPKETAPKARDTLRVEAARYSPRRRRRSLGASHVRFRFLGRWRRARRARRRRGDRTSRQLEYPRRRASRATREVRRRPESRDPRP